MLHLPLCWGLNLCGSSSRKMPSVRWLTWVVATGSSALISIMTLVLPMSAMMWCYLSSKRISTMETGVRMCAHDSPHAGTNWERACMWLINYCNCILSIVFVYIYIYIYTYMLFWWLLGLTLPTIYTPWNLGWDLDHRGIAPIGEIKGLLSST